MRKHYLDNIRRTTVIIVLIYHVFYMYNAEGVIGGLGKITNLNVQYYDAFQYLVYPWIMPLLFIVSGISSRLYLEKHSNKEFIKSRTLKLLVPSTIGLLFFQFIQGYVSMSIGGGIEGLKAAGVPSPLIYMIMVASGSGVLWYMHLLWIYSLLLVLIRTIEKAAFRIAEQLIFPEKRHASGICLYSCSALVSVSFDHTGLQAEVHFQNERCDPGVCRRCRPGRLRLRILLALRRIFPYGHAHAVLLFLHVPREK